MKYLFDEQLALRNKSYGGIQWAGFKPVYMVLHPRAPRLPLTFAHELGHCLVPLVAPGLHRRFLLDCIDYWGQGPTRIPDMIRHEMLAWRLAKSFLRADLWNEAEAIRAMEVFLNYCPEYRRGRLKILEYNRC